MCAYVLLFKCMNTHTLLVLMQSVIWVAIKDGKKELFIGIRKYLSFFFFFDTNVGILLSKPLAVKCYTSALLKVEWVLREGKTKSL